MPRLSSSATASAKASFSGTEKTTKRSVTRIDGGEFRVGGEDADIVGRPDPVGRRQQVEIGEAQIERGEDRPEGQAEKADEPGQQEQIARAVLLPRIRDHVESVTARSPERAAPSTLPDGRAMVMLALLAASEDVGGLLTKCRAGILGRLLRRTRLPGSCVRSSDDRSRRQRPAATAAAGRAGRRDWTRSSARSCSASSSVGAIASRIAAEQGMPRSTPSTLAASGSVTKKLEELGRLFLVAPTCRRPRRTSRACDSGRRRCRVRCAG